MQNQTPLVRSTHPAYKLLWLLLAALFSAQTMHAAKILYVQDFSRRDTVKLINILRAQGHDLTVWTVAVNGNTLPAQDYANQGFQLLIVDEVIGSAAVGATFKDSPIPVINWEGFLYSDGRSSFNSGAGLIGNTYPDGATAASINGGAGADYGQVQNETNINIALPGHPLAAGLPAGLVGIWSPTPPTTVDDGPGVITFLGGRTLVPGATVVATVPGFPAGYCVLGVDSGVTNYDGVTTNKARWVHLPWNDTDEAERVMVEPSFFLFEAAVAWSLRLPQPTKIRNLLPISAGFQPTNLLVSFSVDKTNAAGSAVAQGNIQIKLNGTNVTPSVADGGEFWNVSYTNNILLKDKTYTVIASATAADGGFSARLTQIDTFSPTNYMFEAEDFNFGGGNYFDSIVLCTNIGGSTPNCYFDRVGFTNIDTRELNFVTAPVPITNEVYRFGSGFSREEFVDTFLTSDTLTRQSYVTAGIPDYEVRSVTNSEWLNYTRSYPTGVFSIYARVASAGPMTIQLDLVGGDTTTTNQTLTKLGRFVRSAGTAGYETVPLTDDSGLTTLAVQFTNSGPRTIRMTAVSAGFTPNFFMLVPTTLPPNQPPSVSITSPTNGAVLSEANPITISASAGDTDGTVTNVQFFAGILGAPGSPAPIGQDATSPFSFTFNPAKLGSLAYYTIQVTARDNGGLTATTNIQVKVVDPSLQILTTAVGSGADVQLTEYNYNNATLVTNLDNSANNVQLNARFSSTAIAPTGVHEVVAIRLDLTGFNNSQIRGAALNLMNTRANSAHILHYYAVKDGTAGLDNNGTIAGYTDNTWDELQAGTTTALKFSTMPGLFYDGLPTQGFDTNNVVNLGAATMASGSPGLLVTFGNTALTSFLNTNADSLVTILIDTDSQSTGQKRFASKEVTALESGAAAPAGATNWFAPFLSFTLGNPLLNANRSNNVVQFSWVGAFKLQAQTNTLTTGLRTNWVDYPGGGVSPVNVTINPANPSVFYRLISP